MPAAKFPPRLPFADLESFVTAHYGPDPDVFFQTTGTPRTQTDGRMALLTGLTRTTMLRWRRAGRVPYETADRVGVALGAHPVLIWPNYFKGVLHPCGTLGAALRHKRRKEPLCPPCRRALSDYGKPYQAAWRARQRLLRPPGKPGRKPGVPQKAPEDLKPCGTLAAHRRHRYRDEPICDLCRAAMNAYLREYKRRRRERGKLSA